MRNPTKAQNMELKGTVSVTSSDPPCKNVEDTVFSCLEKCTFLCCFLKTRNAQVTFAKKPQMKINSLKKQKHLYLLYIWSGINVKGTDVNRALSSLLGWSLEITLTVPLMHSIITCKQLQFSSVDSSDPTHQYSRIQHLGFPELE